MGAKQPYLSVIIPAYNEAKRISSTLVDVDRYLSNFGKSYEIVVVNDGSSDKTSVVVERFMKLIPNLSLLTHEDNEGKGAAVRTGMLGAKGKYRLFMDADSSVSIGHFDAMHDLLADGIDVVIGSRDVDGSKVEVKQSLLKRILGNMGNVYIQVLLLRGVWDSQCGFKAFSSSVAEELFSRQRVDGWAFDVEILALARRMKLKIKEIPVHWFNSPDSRVGPSSYFQVFWDVLKVRWFLWKKSYGLNLNK